MKWSTLVALLSVFSLASTYDVEVKQVVDGDTYDVTWKYIHTIELYGPFEGMKLQKTFTKPDRVRLYEVNTFEKFGAEKELGLMVKSEVNQYLQQNPVVKAAYKGKGKFGRSLAIFTLEDGTDLGQWITDNKWNEYVCNRWKGMKWSGRYKTKDLLCEKDQVNSE